MERTGDLAIILGKIESMRSEMVSISSDVQNIREDVNYIKEAQRKGDAKMDEFHALLNKVKELIENNRPSSAEILSSGVQQDYCESPNVSDG
jgi:septation ring formation regulator EzrA